MVNSTGIFGNGAFEYQSPHFSRVTSVLTIYLHSCAMRFPTVSDLIRIDEWSISALALASAGLPVFLLIIEAAPSNDHCGTKRNASVRFENAVTIGICTYSNEGEAI
jgi:hypothetical protein